MKFTDCPFRSLECLAIVSGVTCSTSDVPLQAVNEEVNTPINFSSFYTYSLCIQSHNSWAPSAVGQESQKQSTVLEHRNVAAQDTRPQSFCTIRLGLSQRGRSPCPAQAHQSSAFHTALLRAEDAACQTVIHHNVAWEVCLVLTSRLWSDA